MFSANTSQVSADRLYVEDVFSTYLYTGNVSTRTITNDIDLAGKGGLVWIKARSAAGSDHNLFDTNRGATKRLFTNSATTETTTAGTLTSFQPTGFTLGSSSSTNASSTTYASWTFREAPKFFDVVTYTGDGFAQKDVNHSLGVAPGTIIIKRTDSTGDWWVYHRSTGVSQALKLNTTAAQTSVLGNWGATATNFTTAKTSTDDLNISGATYVAYLFAHDATSDGIIQCGSYTGAGSPYTGGSEVTLGWEPQWVLIKSADNAANWVTIDNMRGWGATTDPTQNWLYPNTSGADNSSGNLAYLTPTGFKPYGSSLTNNTGTYIYIAIRRGPMRTPTSGTSVFSPASPTGSSLPTQIPTGFPVDLGIIRNRTFVDSPYFFDRLRGTTTSSINYIRSDSTAAEAAGSGFGMGLDNNTGVTSNWYSSVDPTISWNFRRAPSFFDEVCYTGTGSARTVNHNLGVAPELMIVKKRNGSTYWAVYASSLGATKRLVLNDNFPEGTDSTYWNNTSPTASVFTVGTIDYTNASGGTYVAYLFASCPGVSKVGSYTGNGSSQTINCGFAAGARFVMIKRTDSTGDWYVWDTARGIVSGNDPRLSLNSNAAEVTTDDSVDTDSSGFVVNQLSATNINVSSATYIYLAVA